MESSTLDADQSQSVTSDERTSQAVVAAVAEAAGVDQTDLPPLFYVVDPDALDALFPSGPDATGSRPVGWVQFTYHGYDVRVRADGRVSVREHADG